MWVMWLYMVVGVELGVEMLMVEKLQVVEQISVFQDECGVMDGKVYIVGCCLQFFCFSLNVGIFLCKLLGQLVLVELDIDGVLCVFYGYVIDCWMEGVNGGMVCYVLIIELWLVFLWYWCDSVVFQDMMVLDIIEFVFCDYQGYGKLQFVW